MVNERIRVGIVGANVNYGWGREAHLPALEAATDFDLRAVCTTRMETAQATASAHGIPLAFDNVEAMVNSPEIDLVVVAVRVPQHYGIVMPALRAKKHVFCEWPLGANLREAEEMRDAAHAAGVVTQVDLQSRGGPQLNQMRDLIANGYVGRITSVTMHASGGGAGVRNEGSAWMADAANGANTLTISAGHNIDAVRYVVGDLAELSAVVNTQFPEVALSDSGRTIPQSSPEQILVAGTLANGAAVSLHVEAVPMFPTGVVFEVHGTEGALVATSELGMNRANMTLRGARRGESALEPVAIDEQYLPPAGTAWGPHINVGTMYGRLADAIRGGAPVDSSFDTAVDLHRLIDAIERASATGQRQQL